MRNFSASARPANDMTQEQAERLHTLMGRFESDPNVDSAMNVFKELNKHGMHLSVIRLFYKYELNRFSGGRGYESMMT